jgi:hypothetical protein
VGWLLLALKPLPFWLNACAAATAEINRGGLTPRPSPAVRMGGTILRRRSPYHFIDLCPQLNGHKISTREVEHHLLVAAMLNTEIEELETMFERATSRLVSWCAEIPVWESESCAELAATLAKVADLLVLKLMCAVMIADTVE